MCVCTIVVSPSAQLALGGTLIKYVLSSSGLSAAGLEMCVAFHYELNICSLSSFIIGSQSIIYDIRGFTLIRR